MEDLYTPRTPPLTLTGVFSFESKSKPKFSFLVSDPLTQTSVLLTAIYQVSFQARLPTSI